MITLERKIIVPADRRVYFDLPETVPEGEVSVVLKFPAEDNRAVEKRGLTPEWFDDITRASPEKPRQIPADKQESAGLDPDIARMMGCYKYTGDTLEAYFERKRADTEYELAKEERLREEGRRHARLPA